MPPGMTSRSVAIRLSLFYGVYFWMVGLNLPYWPVWLESRGLGAAEIGIVVAAAFWTRIFIAPTIALWTDRTGRRRSPLFLLAISVTCGYALMHVMDGYLQILLLYGLVGSLMHATMPLTDSMTILLQSRVSLDYGRVRLWGSITFILASFAGGWILAERGPDAILWSVVAGGAALCLIGFVLPRVRTEPTTRSFAAAARLFREPRFLAFVAAASLLQSSHAVLYAFATLHWRASGIDDRTIGLLWAEGVVAEVILFAIAGRYLARVGPAAMLLLAASAGIIRWTVLGLTADIGTLAIVQLLHAFTFGAVHLGMIRFMSRAIPERLAATAQSLYDSMAMGLVFGSLMIGAGFLYEFQQGTAFLYMAGLSGLGLALALLFRLIWKGERVID